MTACPGLRTLARMWRECALHAHQATVYKRCLGLPQAAASLLALFEMGRYPLQVQRLS